MFSSVNCVDDILLKCHILPSHSFSAPCSLVSFVLCSKLLWFPGARHVLERGRGPEPGLLLALGQHLLLHQLCHGGLGLGGAQSIQAGHHESSLGSSGVRAKQQRLGEQRAGVKTWGKLDHGLTYHWGHGDGQTWGH